MEQTYFAIVYQDAGKGRLALQTLKKLHDTGYLKLKNAVAVTCRADGQLIYEHGSDLNLINPKYGLAGAAGTLVGLIGAAPLGPGALLVGGFMGAVGTSAAIGRDFRQKRGPIQESLRQKLEMSMLPDSSAIVIQADIINQAGTIKQLAQISNGTVIQQYLSPTLYKELAQAIED